MPKEVVPMSQQSDGGFRLLVLILAIMYIVSPIDLIPDPIPIVGWIDDAAVGIGAAAYCLTGRR